MIIREETTNDIESIYNTVLEAFKTAELSDGTEQDLVNIIRESQNFIKELSLVCIENSMIIGHVMLSKFKITDGDKVYDTLILAPLSVKFEFRNLGVGRELVFEALEKAKSLGYTSVFVLGDPNYYNKFGFKESKDFSIRNINDIPDKFSLALELQKDSLKNIKGNIDFNII